MLLTHNMLLYVVVTFLFAVPASEARTRTYYLAAVEEDWDYAPQGNCVNDDTQTSNLFLSKGPDRIGSIYRKVLYRQYTDASFRRQVARPASQGMVGPILRAETGDTIEVVFRNMALQANRSVSVHPHGVQYNKNAEGALYVDQTTGTNKADDGVAPGREFRYVWRVATAFGPTADDQPCLPWAYHSHVAATKDVDSGLVGLLLTCKPGTLYQSGPQSDRRRDVDKEFVLYLDTTDENDSWLLQQNLNKCGSPQSCRQLSQSGDQNFAASNRMSHVNGRVYGNLEGLEVTRGDKVAFYLFSINRGITSVHFSGQVLTVNNHMVDTLTLFPATFVSAIMTPFYPGNWLLASRNVDTYTAGQAAYLRVRPKLPVSWVYGRRRRQVPTETNQVSNAGSNLDLTADPELTGEAEAVAFSGRTLGPWKVFRPRTYYLGVEKYVWDYGPSGQDLYSGGPLTQPGSQASPYFTQGPQRVGGRYVKARYVQYTDHTFRTRQAREEHEQHLGILGPVVVAEVGELVEVVVRNMADRPYSFLPHGVLFDKDNEGFVYRNPDTTQMEGNVVQPQETTVYRFRAPMLSRDDEPCVTFTYHSAVDPVRDVNTGLVGPLVVCKRGQLPKEPWKPIGWGFLKGIARGSPKQWNQPLSWYESHAHVFLNFFTVDENLSWYLQENINTYTSNPTRVDKNDAGFRGANRKHSLNGRMFGNLEGLSFCRGDDVAWHVFGVGGQFDMHGVNFQGQTLEVTGNHVEAQVIIPGSALILTSTPDSIGNWSIACRTNFHFLTGMTAKYEVQDCGFEPQAQQVVGTTRRYYIAAEEMLWDYAPLKRDLVTGENFTNDAQGGYIFVKHTDRFIGSTYKKAVYVEYTDDTFSARRPRAQHEKHLGILGPVIKAEVGDVIEVVFLNKASRPYSVHPQGVQYDKDNEGAKYEDGAQPSAGDSVAPGQRFTYRWRVPERSGPGKNDPSCVAWMYYSSVNSVKDMCSGLVGPLLVCEPNTLKIKDVTTPGKTTQGQSTQGNSGFVARRDVDREFWMLYFVFDENLSWYLADNIQTFAPSRTDPADPDFQLSNRMNAINGLIYGNVPGLVMVEGDVVSWYLLGLGSSFDYHPVHFHGQTFTHRTDRSRRGDVLEVFPSTSAAVEMLCDNPGTWIVHCHFADHVKSGMEATYTILPRSAAAAISTTG